MELSRHTTTAAEMSHARRWARRLCHWLQRAFAEGPGPRPRPALPGVLSRWRVPPESLVRWSLHPRLLTPLANVNVNARSMPATTCRGQGNSPRQSEIPALVEHGLREGGHERVPAEGGGEGVSPREFGAGLYWQREQQVRRSWGEHWAAWASQAAPRLGGGAGDAGACGPPAGGAAWPGAVLPSWRWGSQVCDP